MKTLNVNRNVSTLSATAAVTLGPDVDQLICDATSAGFTVTLCDFNDGADHQVEIIIDLDDVSGNTVTVSGNAGVFSASLSSSGTTSAIFQTQYDGTWFIAGDVSSVSAGAANSRAISAGLAASTAGSTATSQNTSQSANVSTAGSGVTSNSLNISLTGSTASSQNTSQSILLSVVTSTANSG